MISRFNGSDLEIELADVRDHHPHIAGPIFEASSIGIEPSGPETRRRANSTTVLDASILEDSAVPSPPRKTSDESIGGNSRAALVTAYAATGETPTKLGSHKFETPVATTFPPRRSFDSDDTSPPLTPTRPDTGELLSDENPDTRQTRRRSSNASRISSICERRVYRLVPRWVRRPLGAWWGRVAMVLSPEWLRTTLLVWAAWWAMSLGKSAIHICVSNTVLLMLVCF